MSGIAEVLINLGYPVSGSDIKKSAITTRLKRLGAALHYGHAAKNILGTDVVVISSAVKSSNLEVLAAHKAHIPVVQRAEMLAEIMRLARYGIAVAGTHGKTTTTSLIAGIFHTGGLDPTVVIGGKVNSLKSNAKLGKGQFMVAEADESDGSFLKLYPAIAVVTNMDREHMDHYGSFDKYREAFREFCNRLPFYGVAVLCAEHPETQALSESILRRTLLYGFSKNHDWNAQEISYSGPLSEYDLYRKAKYVGRITLNIPGSHNVLNSLAAIAVAEEVGVSFAKIKKALRSYKGVGRRMEIMYQGGGVTAVDDYGHHPVEIQATLSAMRKAFTGRLVVLFQPHRFSRTQDLFTDFMNSFAFADRLFITDIYSAGEAPIPGINGRKLADAIRKKTGDHVSYLPKNDHLVENLIGEIRPNDVFLSLGAGDVTQLGRAIAKGLKKKFG